MTGPQRGVGLPDHLDCIADQFHPAQPQRLRDLQRAAQRQPFGIAIGAGTDVAIESAGVTLLRGDLSGVVKGRAVSRATMANIRQNLVFAFGYNALGIPVAAGLLYPITGQLLSPMIAALAMALSSVSVIVNSLRLGATPNDGAHGSGQPPLPAPTRSGASCH